MAWLMMLIRARLDWLSGRRLTLRRCWAVVLSVRFLLRVLIVTLLRRGSVLCRALWMHRSSVLVVLSVSGRRS